MMAILWGIPYLLIRVAVRQLDPGVLVLGRTGPAALLLLPIVLRRGQWSALWRNSGWIILFGVVEFGGPWFFMATAERHITSSLTSLLICAVPLVSAVVSRFSSSHEPLTRRRLGGLAVGALGVALLVGVNIAGSFTWIALMMIVCVGYAIGPIILATRLAHVPGPAIVCGATAFVALAWTPYSLAHLPHHLHAQTWWAVGALSVLCTAGAFLTFFELVKESGSSRSIVVVYANTGVAVILGIGLLHEPLTPAIIFGFPLIVVGSYLATSSATNARRHSNIAVHQ